MSGESDGLIVLGILAIGGLPLIGTIMAGAAVVGGISAATRAVSSAASARRARETRMAEQERAAASRRASQSVRSTAAPMREVRQTVSQHVNTQSAAARQASEQIQQEIRANRQYMAQVLSTPNPENYQKLIREMTNERQQLSAKLNSMQQKFIRDYEGSINTQMTAISAQINKSYDTSMESLKTLASNVEAKEKLARDIAGDYIGEAEDMLRMLSEQFEAAKYSPLALADLNNALNTAKAQYNNGNYEAALAAAKAVTLDVTEEIFKTDAKRQDWENSYELAYSLAAELKAYIEAQNVVTPETLNQARAVSKKEIDDEILGIHLGEYTARRPDGRTQYDYLYEKASELVSLLESEEGQRIPADTLKTYADTINTKLYPQAAQCVFNAVLNLSNAFSRQNIGEELIDFFEEHNFDYTGSYYDDEERDDSAIHIGLENKVTGEEIIVSLSPEVMADGQVQTRVGIDQLKGDETNEERKEFFRQSVQKVVCDSNPGANVNLQCKKDTRNKLSAKTQLRDRLA